MKKERVEKGLERMRTYLDDSMRGEYSWVLNPDTEYMKAVKKTFEQIEVDDLDSQSKMWFLEDEAEFMEEYSRLLDDVKRYRHFGELLAQNLEQIDTFEDE